MVDPTLVNKLTKLKNLVNTVGSGDDIGKFNQIIGAFQNNEDLTVDEKKICNRLYNKLRKCK